MRCSKGMTGRDDRRYNRIHFHLFEMFSTFAHLDIIREMIALLDV